MNTIDYVLIALVAVVLGLVIWYIRRAKKKGAKCIGCPACGNCAGGCAGCSGGKAENM